MEKIRSASSSVVETAGRHRETCRTVLPGVLGTGVRGRVLLIVARVLDTFAGGEDTGRQGAFELERLKRLNVRKGGFRV